MVQIKTEIPTGAKQMIIPLGRHLNMLLVEDDGVANNDLEKLEKKW